VRRLRLRLWTLTKDDRVLRCELHADLCARGWDFQLLDAEGLLSTSLRPTEDNARDAAEYVRQVHLRDGWTETAA
jgi:hypothetical protein